MRFKNSAVYSLLTVLLSLGPASAAIIIPTGIQSNFSQATVDSWGWTEIHRSPAESNGTNIAAILAAATGDYLMMGVWDEATNRYAILGAGETNVVAAITYYSSNFDDSGVVLNNWSNGLNFYRTEQFGSWGFTTNSRTQLNYADLYLNNGVQSGAMGGEVTLSQGVSFHQSGPSLNGGWAYNVTGNNHVLIGGTGTYERVFFTANAENVATPEPATLAIWGSLGLAGIVAARRRKKLAA